MKRILAYLIVVCCFAFVLNAAEGSTATVKGWVLDSSCALTHDLKKPISTECAIACAKAGSPLAILDDKGHLYLPVSATMPAASQNDKLLPFAGQRVVVTGKVFEKSGSHGIEISDIKAEGK
ncbi:MAG: hypothetical protein WBW33_12900 [Bryobacteraceae bacterium]